MAALRWALLIAGAAAIVVLGILRLARRSEPPPVIKEVPDFALTHYDGSTVGREQLAGEPWVADFIFTRCPAICPRMTSQMARVAVALGDGSPVRIVSFSVDPEHDTPEVLADYAAQHGAGAGWYFLTGDKEAIYALSREGFLLGLDAAPPDAVTDDGQILHSNRFVLVDQRGRIRGYYDPFDEAELARLLADVRSVLRER
jgi:protein SCO1